MRNTLLVTTLFAGAIFANNARAEDVEVTRRVIGMEVSSDNYSVSCDANGCSSGGYKGYVQDGTFYVTSMGGSYGNEFSYTTDGLVKQETGLYDGNPSFTNIYSYHGNTVVVTEPTNPDYMWTATFENNIKTAEDLGSDNMIYSVTKMDGQLHKYMRTPDAESGGEIYYNTEGKIDRYEIWHDTYSGSYYFDDNENLTGSYTEPYEEEEGSPAEYAYNYDGTTGKPVSKTDKSTGNIVEKYDFTEDGKLKVCDANGTNCEVTAYDNLRAYVLGELNDVFDSDFGMVGYVPSRLKANETTEKNNDGSYTIRDANGKIIGYKGKRIYTIEEANQVAGEVNTIRIRYR